MSSEVLEFGRIISFKPFEEVADIIVREIENYIGGSKEIGEDETAVEWIGIVNGIKEKGILAYEGIICGYIEDMFDAVCGMPSKYLGKDGVEFFDSVCEYYDPSATVTGGML